MAACGISLRANTCTIVLVRLGKSDHIEVVASTKLELGDDRDQGQLITFRETVKSFVTDHSVQSMTVKGRAQKGQFSGGPVSFKMEALIQSLDNCSVLIVSPQTMAAYLKKEGSSFNETGLYKYFEESFDVACYELNHSSR